MLFTQFFYLFWIVRQYSIYVYMRISPQNFSTQIVYVYQWTWTIFSSLDVGKSIFMRNNNGINIKRTLWCWNFFIYGFSCVCTRALSTWTLSITINSYNIFAHWQDEMMLLFSFVWTLCSCLVASSAASNKIYVHEQMQVWCGPRTCWKRKKCIPKHSILFICVCTPEITNMSTNENWGKKTHLKCVHCHMTIAHSINTHWHQFGTFACCIVVAIVVLNGLRFKMGGVYLGYHQKNSFHLCASFFFRSWRNRLCTLQFNSFACSHSLIYFDVDQCFDHLFCYSYKIAKKFLQNS